MDNLDSDEYDSDMDGQFFYFYLYNKKKLNRTYLNIYVFEDNSLLKLVQFIYFYLANGLKR